MSQYTHRPTIDVSKDFPIVGSKKMDRRKVGVTESIHIKPTTDVEHVVGGIRELCEALSPSVVVTLVNCQVDVKFRAMFKDALGGTLAKAKADAQRANEKVRIMEAAELEAETSN